jgi:hypothetical protein
LLSGTSRYAVIVPIAKIIDEEAIFDVDPKGIFNGKSVALPGPWSVAAPSVPFRFVKGVSCDDVS